MKPDVIIVYLGTNDWAFGAELDGTRLLSDELNMQYFAAAYETMIGKIKTNYQNAEIWCCTLNATSISSNQSFTFPYKYGGTHIEEYNKIIKDTADMYNCKVIDLYSYHIPYDSIDSSHPNANGMNTLATLICHKLSDDNGKQFIDFDNNQYLINDEKLKIVNTSNVSEKKRFCHKCGTQLNLNDRFCMKCGTQVIDIETESPTEESEKNRVESVSDVDDVPETIDNRYKLIRQTGKGASAIVYLAQDMKLNRVCAVKIVKKNTYSNKMAAQELLEEVNKMKLLAHISIPQLYDIYDDDDRLCIVMEFIEGQNLSEIINSQKTPLDEYIVVSWAKQLCRVLFYLHTLKPP